MKIKVIHKELWDEYYKRKEEENGKGNNHH